MGYNLIDFEYSTIASSIFPDSIYFEAIKFIDEKDFEIIINSSLSNYYASIDRAALLTQSKDKNIR